MIDIMKPTIIYVSGAPGSGKTTLARHLSMQLNIPQISSDLVHGGIAFVRPDHDRGETIRDIFVPHMINTSKLGVSFVVDHVLQKSMASETIIAKLKEHANVLYIHTQTSDPITRYKHNIETSESMDVNNRKDHLLARAHYHANNLDNTMHKIELDVPTLVVNTDENYNPNLEKIVKFIQSHK